MSERSLKRDADAEMMRLRYWKVVLVLLPLEASLFAVAPGCQRRSAAPTSSHPSVILITIDALRPDRLSCYGYQARQTLHLDALARDGVLFEHALCDVPWTTGSMASVLSGQYASIHQVRLSTERLSGSAVTLAEVLRDHGYTTGAIIGSFPLASIYNLNQGFDSYDDNFDTPMVPAPPGEPVLDEHGRPWSVQKITPLLRGEPEAMQRYFAEKVTNDAYRPDNEVTDRAVAWLRQHRDESFFLWVHYFGPHERVNLFETWEHQSPRVIAEYDRDLAFTDTHVGRLLDGIDALGLRAHTLLVLHADHGQSLGENQYVGHGDNLYPANLGIPLLMRLPGRIAAGRRISELAENVDIFPTILGLLGIVPPAGLSGVNLAPDSSSPTPAGRVAYAETFASTIQGRTIDTPEYGPLTVHLARFGLLRVHRMYVRSEPMPPCQRVGGAAIPEVDCVKLGTEELFDPFDRGNAGSNLLNTEPAVASWFREQLPHYRQSGPGGAEPVQLGPGDREKLRALGYEG